jgi:hypothetical protein
MKTCLDHNGFYGTSTYGKWSRVHTEWQLPISGVHSIMMENSALYVTYFISTPYIYSVENGARERWFRDRCLHKKNIIFKHEIF